MPTDAAETRALLGDVVDSARRLAVMLDQAVAVQWQAPPVYLPSKDTTERSKGGPPSDPTADVALDERRLALRSAVESAALSLRVARASIEAAERRLDGSLAAWEGAAPVHSIEQVSRVDLHREAPC